MRDKKSEIPSDSRQWSNLDYKIQLVTGKSSIKLLKVQKFDNYEQDYTNKWTQGVVNLTDYGKQYIRMVIDQKAPLEQVIFYTGHINIHKYSTQPYKIYTFLLCDIKLGLSGKDGTINRQDCDSLNIGPQQQDDAFQYNYIVKEYHQYKPKYYISFSISDDKQFRIQQYQCSNCQNRIPTMYCITEKLYFCEQCFYDHHKTKLMQTHQRQQIDKINTLDICKNHNQKYQYYCLKCHRYLCPVCTNKGIHSQNSEHPIQPISFLYDKTSENIDLLPKKNLQKIQVILHNLKIKRKQIQENQQHIRGLIQKQYQTSLKRLSEQMAMKYQVLDSCEMQLNYLKEKVQWARSFAMFQYKSLKPIQYFKSQAKFQELIKNLKVSEFQPIFLCKADIIYESDIKIGPQQIVQRLRKPDSRFLKTSNIKQKNSPRSDPLLIYNPNHQLPRVGQLWHQITKTDLSFFEVQTH